MEQHVGKPLELRVWGTFTWFKSVRLTACDSTVRSALPPTTVGLSSSFTVSTRDAFGNNVVDTRDRVTAVVTRAVNALDVPSAGQQPRGQLLNAAAPSAAKARLFLTSDCSGPNHRDSNAAASLCDWHYPLDRCDPLLSLRPLIGWFPLTAPSFWLAPSHYPFPFPG